jgi:hypothetical protein
MGKTRDTGNFVSDGIAFADIANDRLGIKKTDPSSALDVNGTITASSVPFFRTGATISANYLINSAYNEMSIGPITINNGVTVTISSGGNWVII